MPSGVAPTPNVTFQYDAAGNRTSMSSSESTVSYSYDTASRLTSETRSFNGVAGSFSLNYAYNQAGQLTEITNPWGVKVGYNYNFAGEVTGVTGQNYGGVSTYASGLVYRAFGGLKQMNYGNGKSLSLGYNNRMFLTQWNVPGVMVWNYAYATPLIQENTGRVAFADNLYDATLDRSYDYDYVGRMWASHTGQEGRGHAGYEAWGPPDGPYAENYSYDQFGNLTWRNGWGAVNAQYVYNPGFSNNRMTVNPVTGAGMSYDAAGNLINDGTQSFTYDATGQQVYASATGLAQSYDGDRLRVKKIESGASTYYLRSTVLGGQVIAELNATGGWTRGYVYLGGQMVALQGGTGGQVSWVHQDPVTKSQQIRNSSGTVVSTIDLDPWGGETGRSSNQAFQPHRFTTYERDANGGDEAMHRRYQVNWSRFAQPDPYDGSYSLTDPQSFNRYAYVQNDPVNFVDPSGLCIFNVNISGVSGQALSDMQNEMRRIFESGGHSVVFGQPGRANGGSMNLTVTSQYSGNTAAVLGSQVNSPTLLGATVVGSGEAQISLPNIFEWQGGGRPVRPGTFASYGTIYGRIGAHEVVTHGFLPTDLESYSLPFDIRTSPSPRELISRYTARFNMNAYTAAALNALCPPIPEQSPTINTNPIPLRPTGGGGGGGSNSPGGPGGSGGGPFDPFRLLDIWIESMRRASFREEDYLA
ncbi:MAG TPA: RHS repeat-associated core domain-containing protein [Pyrinomonadaceae bacterium]|nr:RHS repeat-associated core domain-containing protein [Pyrinomonadaceae bacterium]